MEGGWALLREALFGPKAEQHNWANSFMRPVTRQPFMIFGIQIPLCCTLQEAPVREHSLNRNGLGEIPRLIHIGPQQVGDVVRQKL